MNKELSEACENAIHVHCPLLREISDRLQLLAMTSPHAFARTMAKWYLDDKVPDDELFRIWAALTRESPSSARRSRSNLLAELLLETAEDMPASLGKEFVTVYDVVRQKALEALRVEVCFFVASDGSALTLTPLTEMTNLLNKAVGCLEMYVDDPASWVRNGLPLYHPAPGDTYTVIDQADPVMQLLLFSQRLGAKLAPEPLPEWMANVFVRIRDKQAHDRMFAGRDCYDLTGEEHAERRRALRRLLELPDTTCTAGGLVTDDYLQSDHPRYTPKLAAAVRAWQAVTEPLPGSTVKQSLERWLTENAGRFGLSAKAIEECSAVSNWNTRGGAPKTPG